MVVPAEHEFYLQRNDFVPDCPTVFSAEEQATLARYGRWMEALASGAIAPATPEQEHFVRAARGEAVPTNWFEQVWVKVGRYRNASVPPGMVTRGHPRDRASESQVERDTLPGKLSQLAEAKRKLDAVRESVEAERREVLKAVEVDLMEIEARYAGQLEEISQIVSEIEAEVRAEVLQAGHSVRAEGVQVIYYRPRVTWNTKALARYAETNPEVEQFRKVGRPSVSLRYRS